MTGIMHSIIAPLGGSTGLVFAIDTANINVHDQLIAQGWDGISVVNPSVIILPSAKIYSNSTSIPSFSSGTLPVGSTINIVLSGAIVGKGGNAGNALAYIGAAGGAGGTAFQTSVPTTITNNGVIAGGGGGGGGGGGRSGGGGGAGRGLSASNGGAGIFGGGYGGDSNFSTIGAGGSGMALYYIEGFGQSGGTGGNGGDFGNAGSSGAPGVWNNNTYSGGSGGAPGAAVSGDSLITWTVLGTIIGARVG